MFLSVLFFVFFFICVAIEHYNVSQRNTFLAISCLFLSLLAGFRSLEWSDTGIYVISFWNTNDLWNYSFSDKPYGYSEKGFYFIGVLVKTFLNNETVFLCVISLLTFYFLYKDFKEYSIYPLIGLCAYISRFYIGRNFMQIRAGLAYAILMLCIKYIQKKDWKRYFLLVFIAWTIHRSAIIAVPLYFVCNWMKVKKWHVIVVLVFSFIVGIFGQGFVHALVEDSASDLNVGLRYTDAGRERTMVEGLGIRNPMIYFQCVILLAYTFLEKKLVPLNKYYYIIRTAYLYSVMILICFCTYKVLSSRTSSMFATLEFTIIPSLIFLFNKKNRQLAFFVTGIILTGIFFMYYTRGG